MPRMGKWLISQALGPMPVSVVHQAAWPSAKSRRSFRLQNRNEISDTDHCLILVALLRGQLSFGAFVSQLFNSPLHLRVGTYAQQRLGALSVKALPDSRKHALQGNLR
jgi:hypothetical protein